jgi:hypothetical protein
MKLELYKNVVRLGGEYEREREREREREIFINWKMDAWYFTFL